jgi:hypothetical protein
MFCSSCEPLKLPSGEPGATASVVYFGAEFSYAAILSFPETSAILFLESGITLSIYIISALALRSNMQVELPSFLSCLCA